MARDHINNRVSVKNSTATALAGAGVFTGEWEDALYYATIRSVVDADASGTIAIQYSDDKLTAIKAEDTAAVTGGTPSAFLFSPNARYFRVVYTNGGTPQASFRLKVLLQVQPQNVESIPAGTNNIGNVGLIDASDVRINPATEDTLATLASESTLDAFRTDFNNEDFASETTLDNLRTDFNNEDFATETTQATLATQDTAAAILADLQLKADKTENQPIASGDSPSIDAFGRWRVSNPATIFDSKQIFDNQPLFWDDQETSGAGTTSTHDADEAASTMGVALNTAGTRVRQTFQRFNYQPGKSQLILLTGILDASGGGSGINRKIGYFDENNGLYFQDSNGTPSVARRSNVTGTPVDSPVAQVDWNIDPLNGAGPSGIALNFSLTQIFLIDFEWLGVGRVRMGFVIDGIIVYCHQFLNANVLDKVYMSTPNLPLRYEITNSGSGAASTLVQICASVISEGGEDDTGILRCKSTGGTHVDANTADTIYAVVGLRLKSAYIGAQIKVDGLTVLAETNDDFEWMLIFNPTVAGTFTYADEINSAAQTATGATANTVTGGTVLACGFADASAPVIQNITTSKGIGSSISGTVDEVVLCVRPLSSNADIQGSLTWRELS